MYIINGKIIEGLNFSAQPVYSESQARNLAIASIGASQYAWESTTWEQGLKDDKGDPNATYYPTGILTITNLSGTSVDTSNFRLTWKFEIFAISPSSQQTVYVNAITGAVLKTIDMGRNNGPAGTLFDGTQTIDTKWFGGFHGHHHLETDDNGKKIQTKNGSYSEGWDALNHVYDNDDTWGLDVPTVRTTGAHWVISRSWDFYKDTYGRTGPRNNNSCRVGVFGNSTLANNATYRPTISTNNVDFVEFGTSTSGNIHGIPAGVNYASLDIGGHEYTHAITRNEAYFTNSGESGALDESFVDIFGTMIERYARGGVSNEVIQTTNAWAAVSVGPVFSWNCLSLNGERILCKKSPAFPYVYVAQGIAGATFSWTFPPAWTGILTGSGNNIY